MYRSLKVAVVVPCYNEEKLAPVTVKGIPDYVDTIYAVNDASKDGTLAVLKHRAKKDARITVVNNEVNLGLGGSMLRVFTAIENSDNDLLVVMAGDNQMDPKRLPALLDALIDNSADFAKANRFAMNQSLEQMPKYRKIGNVIVSILTKFSTGYYSLFDSQNGYVVYKVDTIRKLPKHIIGTRYEYENTVLVALSIIGAKVVDVPIPAVYGEEKSTINLLGTTLRTIKALHKGFWQRIYYKYVMYSFHPIALFLFTSIVLFLFSFAWVVFILYAKLFKDISATTGTTMLAVIPFVLAVQFLLTAIILDTQEEHRAK